MECFMECFLAGYHEDRHAKEWGSQLFTVQYRPVPFISGDCKNFIRQPFDMWLVAEVSPLLLIMQSFSFLFFSYHATPGLVSVAEEFFTIWNTEQDAGQFLRHFYSLSEKKICKWLKEPSIPRKQLRLIKKKN